MEERDELDGQLRQSPYLREALTDLLRSTEQALAIIATAAAQQGDPVRFAADLLELQQRAAMAAPNPTRDRLLGSVRDLLGGRLA